MRTVSVYLLHKTERGTKGLDEVKLKNLCAQIPETLHSRVRQEQERSGKTLSEYMTWLINEFYEGGKETTMEETRTLAIQVSEELFERLDRYVKEHRLKKRTFLIDLITRALEEAEDGEAEAAQDSEAAEDTETTEDTVEDAEEK